jgi:hypothetical protein
MDYRKYDPETGTGVWAFEWEAFIDGHLGKNV